VGKKLGNNAKEPWPGKVHPQKGDQRGGGGEVEGKGGKKDRAGELSFVSNQKSGIVMKGGELKGGREGTQTSCGKKPTDFILRRTRSEEGRNGRTNLREGALWREVVMGGKPKNRHAKALSLFRRGGFW